MAATAMAKVFAGVGSLVGSLNGAHRVASKNNEAAVGAVFQGKRGAAAVAAVAQKPSAALLPSSPFLGNRVVLEECRAQGSRQSVPQAPSGPRAAADKEAVYVVTLEKPVGLNFYRGSDGGTYIEKIQKGGSADETGLFEVGDKVLETSAVFGSEMWGAAEFGRTMYTIKTRVGNVTFKMEKKFGVKQEVADAPDQFKQERRSGNYGDGIKEVQRRNYLKQQELKKLRAEKIESGLKLYRQGKYEEALVDFETVLGSKPTDREEAVASYNVACCYSKLGNIEAGLDALDSALNAGFDDYKAVREDADLEKLRTSSEFSSIINKYDEPFINENAVKALKSVFGFLKR